MDLTFMMDQTLDKEQDLGLPQGPRSLGMLISLQRPKSPRRLDRMRLDRRRLRSLRSRSLRRWNKSLLQVMSLRAQTLPRKLQDLHLELDKEALHGSPCLSWMP